MVATPSTTCETTTTEGTAAAAGVPPIVIPGLDSTSQHMMMIFDGVGGARVATCSACAGPLHTVVPGTTFCSERCRRAEGWTRQANAERTPYMKPTTVKSPMNFAADEDDATNDEAPSSGADGLRGSSDDAFASEKLQEKQEATAAAEGADGQQQQQQVALQMPPMTPEQAQALQLAQRGQSLNPQQIQCLQQYQVQLQQHQLQQQQQLHHQHLQQLFKQATPQRQQQFLQQQHKLQQQLKTQLEQCQNPQQQHTVVQQFHQNLHQAQQQFMQQEQLHLFQQAQAKQQVPPHLQLPAIAHQIAQLRPEQQQNILGQLPVQQQQLILQQMAYNQQLQQQQADGNDGNDKEVDQTAGSVEAPSAIQSSSPHDASKRTREEDGDGAKNAASTEDDKEGPLAKHPRSMASPIEILDQQQNATSKVGPVHSPSNNSAGTLPLTLSESDERLKNFVVPPAFNDDGLADLWGFGRALVVRVGSNQRKTTMAMASGELDALLASKSSNSSYSFARRFAEAAREFIGKSSGQITLGWHAKSAEKPPSLFDIHRTARDKTASLEAEYIGPLLVKLWNLHCAAASCVPAQDAGLFATDSRLDKGLRYPIEEVGWNKVLLDISTVRQSDNWDEDASPCAIHSDSVGVSPILVLNVGDYPMPGGRMCLLADSQGSRPVVVATDESRAICLFADFQQRQRAQLPFEKPTRATKRELIRISIIPYCSSDCALWSGVVCDTNSRWAKCSRCHEWSDTEGKLTKGLNNNWACKSCKAPKQKKKLK